MVFHRIVFSFFFFFFFLFVQGILGMFIKLPLSLFHKL
jgi:hypothetical protein